MIQKIVTVPNPILRQKSKPVVKISAKGGSASGWDKKTLEIIQNLKDTLASQKNPKGVGISAPQIGKSVRICLIYSKGSKKLLTLINPEIIWQSKRLTKIGPKTKTPLEGCLSVPDYWGPVIRYKQLKIRYLAPSRQIVTRKFSNFTGTIIQHEIDHLDGILFIDRILQQKARLPEGQGKLYKIEKNAENKDELVEVKIG